MPWLRPNVTERKMMRPKFGSLEWGLKTCGIMTAKEKILFLRNLAFLEASKASDALREKLGLIKPIGVELSVLTPPDTRMAKDAESFAVETHTKDLLFHSYRTYYFGALLGIYHKISYDKELLFTAAILHDLGLTESRATPLKECCFAVSGGKQVRDFLLSKKHEEEKVKIVGEAISAHMNFHLTVDDYGPVAALLTKGAVCDILGFETRKIRQDFKESLTRAYPKGDLARALLTGVPMAPGSRLDFYRSLKKFKKS